MYIYLPLVVKQRSTLPVKRKELMSSLTVLRPHLSNRKPQMNAVNPLKNIPNVYAKFNIRS